MGPLMGGGGGVPNVDVKKWQCRMSLSLIFLNVPCQIKEMNMSHVTTFLAPIWHVEFKKCLCRCVDFRGLGPSQWQRGSGEVSRQLNEDDSVCRIQAPGTLMFTRGA